MIKSRVYQIFYNDETREAVDPAFEPLDNMANERPDWREYWPMRKFLLANTLEPDTFYGFLSPRFCSKANIPAAEVIAFIEKMGETSDLVSFSPFPDHNGLFINVIEQGEYAHPGLAGCMQAFLDITPAEFERIMNVNARGALFAMQAAARRMIEQGGGGSIVNIASGVARRPAPGAASYSASKAALVSLTQVAAQELIRHGIRVNAIAPGAVRTPMWTQVDADFSRVLGVPPGTAESAQVAATPAGRMADPVDFVGAAIFLASPESAYVVGQTLNVDGGMNFG